MNARPAYQFRYLTSLARVSELIDCAATEAAA